MTEAIAENELELALIDAEPFRMAVRPDDRRFWLGLVAAVLVHLTFLVGFNAQGVRQIGDPTGAADAIGVDFISDTDLKRISSMADQAAGAPVPQSNPAPPPQAEAPAQAETPPPQPETPPAPAEAAPPPKPAEHAAASPKAEDALESVPTLEDTVEALRQRTEPSRPEPQRKSEPKAEPPKPKSPQQQQPTRLSRLDLSLPPSVLSGPSGSGGMGLDRPAGITRSGENDAFARGVISALQRNMPQLRETRGQVTVRITLDKDGDLVRTEVVRPSSLPDLDQSVVFSTRQASFPFPPRNARAADLVFLVTYIYR